MRIRLSLTLFISKAFIKLLRVFKLGGTSLPGKIAMKLEPNIIKILTKGFKIIVVTGTNGKTTTTRIIGQIFTENQMSYLTNKSGANLVFGIASVFIEACDFSGKFKMNTALLEVDEAAFRVLTRHIQPDIVVVTNFFRDQLDRYGELYTTLKGVAEGLSNSPNTKVALNADDSMCASLESASSNNILFYGFERDSVNSIEENINSDAMFCIHCKSRYMYDFHIFGHLGGFSCPQCGYKRPDAVIKCMKIIELNTQYTTMSFSVGDENIHEAKVNLPGLYNAYNALAAISISQMLGLPIKNTIKALGTFECGFGRMETISAGDKTIKVILVKNPTGFNQVLNYLLTEDKNMQLAFLINDKAADGRDISWLWDVDFERLESHQDKFDNVYTSGLRALDMAVRLKYAAIHTSRIEVIHDYQALIDKGLSRTKPGGTFYILPTYTAMLEIRNILKKMFNLRDFWK